ncbi:MAG: lysine transporter LysE [Bacteroidetes bacterium]|nr:lysine transporter LysE [Bacteroidota bacterium]
MIKLMQVLLIGLLVSFVGSLPLGTLNVAAMQISIISGVQAALLFSLGALLAEMIYVRLSLVAIDWFRKRTNLLRVFDFLTIILLIVLAIANFQMAFAENSQHRNPIIDNALPKILLGFLMSAINPVQIPFWFGWSTVLFSRGLLVAKPAQYNAYIIGIGLGTLLGNSIFIFGGQLVATTINNNQSIVSAVIGSIFLITAGLQLYKLFRNKDAAHRINQLDIEADQAGQQLDRWAVDVKKK